MLLPLAGQELYESTGFKFSGLSRAKTLDSGRDGLGNGLSAAAL